MSLPSAEMTFLPERSANAIVKFDCLGEQLEYPNDNFESAWSQLRYASTYAAMLIAASTRTLIAAGHMPSVDDAVSTQSMESILIANSYNALLIDSEHSTLAGVAALATGVLLSSKDSDTARHGFELGSRIISQRARLNAHSLIVSLLNSRANLGFDGGGSLLVRASKFYDSSGRRDMSPLAKVPKSVGSQADEISHRVYSEDNFDNSHVSSIDIGRRRRGPLGRRGINLKNLNAGAKLAKKAINPDRATEVVEEIFDTYLGYPLLRMEDREALLVSNFTQSVFKYYEIAGRAIPEIRHDPRTRYMGLLVNKLSGMNIPKSEAAFKKTAHAVSKEGVPS